MTESIAPTESTSTITYPAQRILFGSPGTGKSHKVHTQYLQGFEPENVFKTVFHPEYKYGDFMGRLIPLTDEDGKVRYEYQAGHFLKALAKAYQCWLNKGTGEAKKVALVIDEINRGNSSAIFGTVFQLLDRDEDYCSSYELDLSAVELDCLKKLIGCTVETKTKSGTKIVSYELEGKSFEKIEYNDKKSIFSNGKIKLPPNLSIFATMNTSDESIYYMDSAFKRRWDWEFVPVDGELTIPEGNAFDDETAWKEFVGKLNAFIKSNAKHIRKVEDKLIGYYFLKGCKATGSEGKYYTYDQIQSKLMFFLWDSVFSHSKEPLNVLLDLKDEKSKLVTFGDFANKVEDFVNAIKAL